MGRRKGQGPQQPMKGFRPGKEPPQMKKRRAKQQFGEMNAAQERMVELFAERTPEESRAMLRRWQIGLLTAGVILAIVAGLLFSWSWIAGSIVGALAVVVLFFWWRFRRQQEAFEAMADAVSGRGGRGGKRGRRK